MKKIIIIIILVIILALFLFYKISANIKNKEKTILIAQREDFQKIYNEIHINKNDKVLKSYKAIQTRADEILKEPLCKYEIDEGNRMLDVSRKCKETMEVLGFTIKMMELENKNDKTEEYIKRAIEELKNVSSFKDWHPSHFLDVAEMTYSVALGYNWLYEYLSDENKQLIEDAIINNGLISGISQQYTKSFVDKKNNWNPICNGALGISAVCLINLDREIELDIGTIDYQFQCNYLKIDKKQIYNNKYKIKIKDLCNAIINRAKDKIPLVYEEMQDGAYDEGTLYWEYGNSYLANFLSTLYLSYGDTSNLVNDEILKNTILYPIYMTGKSSNHLPNCKLFNYGDADEDIVNTSCSTWLANVYYKDKEFSQIINWYQDNYFETQNIYQLLWQNYDFSIDKLSENEKDNILNKIQDKKYNGVELVILQNNFLKKNGFYVGVKAGKNSNTNHSDLDAGSFVLDAKGTRWIEDEGREYYNVYKYWDRTYTRWKYYKKRTESHSTLVINNENQKINTECKIVDFISETEKSSVTLDLSDAYNLDNIDKNNVFRKITLDKINNKVTLEDSINLSKESKIYSMFNISEDTKISLENENKTAILIKNVLQDNGEYKQETLTMEIDNSKYSWTILPKKPIEPELLNTTENPDYKYNIEKENENKLCIKIEEGNNEIIKVEIN